AHRARRMTQRRAVLAALDAELAGRDAVPPPTVVVPERRPKTTGLRRHRRRRGALGVFSGSRNVGLEAQDAERHPADPLAVLVAEGGARVDEVPDTEAGRLLLRDRLEERLRRDAIA